MNTYQDNSYEMLGKEMKNVLTPLFPSMLYKNEYIELGRVIDTDFVFGIHLYFTTKPHMFVMVKSPVRDQFTYINYSAAQFEATDLLIQISNMVTTEFNELLQSEKLELIKGIANSLYKALDTFDSPEVTTSNEVVQEDFVFKTTIIESKYMKLKSDRYITNFFNFMSGENHSNLQVA